MAPGSMDGSCKKRIARKQVHQNSYGLLVHYVTDAPLYLQGEGVGRYA